jgi:hypothetical protein
VISMRYAPSKASIAATAAGVSPMTCRPRVGKLSRLPGAGLA